MKQKKTIYSAYNSTSIEKLKKKEKTGENKLKIDF